MPLPKSVEDRVRLIASAMCEGRWGSAMRHQLLVEWECSPATVGAAAAEASRRITTSSTEVQSTATAVLERVQALALDLGDARSLDTASRTAAVLLGHSRSQTPPSVEAAVGTIRYLAEHDPGALRHALRECAQLLTEALGSAELAERLTKSEAENG